MNEKNYINDTEIPLGLGMALAKNLNALNKFAALSDQQRKQVIRHTHQIQSKEEMQAYVTSMFQG